MAKRSLAGFFEGITSYLYGFLGLARRLLYHAFEIGASIVMIVLVCLAKGYFMFRAVKTPNAHSKSSSSAHAKTVVEPIEIPSDPAEALARIMKSDEQDLYKILGASSTATPEEMKKLFRRQSLMVHPDKNKHKVCVFRRVLMVQDAMEAFKRLSHAYELLGDEVCLLIALFV
jgi:hypothetical protein